MGRRGTPSVDRLHLRPRPGLALAAMVGLSAASLGALASCGEGPPFPFDDATCEAALGRPDAVDAFAWLKDPYGGEKRLGGWSTDQGLAFALELESRGAVRVVAVGVRKREGEGEESSQEAVGLVAQMPDDPSKRRRLFELHARQARSAGYKPRADTGQKFLYFCWKT